MMSCNTKGFTLIELLFAVLIFSISLLALVPLLTTAASIDRENYLNVTARAMAADVLDTLMGDTVPPYASPSSVTDDGVAITRSWNVVQVGNLDNIAVTVQYLYKGQLKTFTLTAQKAR
jgi:prepilin-type N-terminal cleavage/methylation domain-containing protein